MKPKKIIFDILIILAAFFLFIIWYERGQNKAIQTSASVNQKYKIYLITMDKVNQYWDILNQGSSDMARFLGVTYVWDAPLKRDVDTQIDLVNKAVENGANAILLTAIDARRLAEPVKNAKARGVQVVYVDSPANEEAVITLATDNYEAGRVAGRTMLEELEAAGINSGKIAIVAINQTTDNTVRRESGFREVITADRRFTILETAYAQSNLELSQKAATQFIQENQDLVGMFGTDEISSEGIGMAIKESGNKVIGIGFDKSDITMKLLEEDSLKAIVVQNPYTMGYLGMAEALASLKGYNTGPRSMNTGVSVLRKR